MTAPVPSATPRRTARRNTWRGFTLVEMIVVLVIMLALAGIGLATFSTTVSDSETKISAVEANKVELTFRQLASTITNTDPGVGGTVDPNAGARAYGSNVCPTASPAPTNVNPGCPRNPSTTVLYHVQQETKGTVGEASDFSLTGHAWVTLNGTTICFTVSADASTPGVIGQSFPYPDPVGGFCTEANAY